MAGISRLQVHLLHSAPPALKSTTLLSRCSHFSCSTPRKIFTPRLLCSTPQSSSLEAGSSSSSVGDLLDYLNESWTQFYATAEAKRQLVAAGFHLLNEAEEWYLKPCGCYFFTRDMSCLVAFSIGEKFCSWSTHQFVAFLASSYCALRALIDSCESPSDLKSVQAVRMVALFDNEEVGSGSIQGAGAPTMFQAMRRIASCLGQGYVGEGAFERAFRQSFLEEHHRPEMPKGLVIKRNANQRYATSGVTSFLFREIGRIHNLPTPVRNATGCGSTIGPILGSGASIRTVDCGIPQLSMRRQVVFGGITEICGKEDVVDTAYKCISRPFMKRFRALTEELKLDV